jgi:hypothetical protein
MLEKKRRYNYWKKKFKHCSAHTYNLPLVHKNTVHIIKFLFGRKKKVTRGKNRTVTHVNGNGTRSRTNKMLGCACHSKLISIILFILVI